MNDLKRLPRFVALTLIMVFLLLVWQGYARYQHFTNYHQEMAQHSVEAVSGEISNLIQSYRRLARLYVTQYHQELTGLLLTPHHQTSIDKLADALTKFLPEYSDFSLADARGKPYFTLHSGELGGPCLVQLLDFARSGSQQQPIKIHHNDKGSHFDIVTEFSTLTQNGFFFVSFHVKRLDKILSNGEVRGHVLGLLRQQGVVDEKENQQTPTVTRLSQVILGKGAFNKKVPLSSLFMQPVEHTPWVLIDMAEADLFEREQTYIVLKMGFIFFVFAMIGLSVLLLTRREAYQTKDTTLTIDSIEEERTRIAMDLHDQVLGEITHRIRETDCYLMSCQENDYLHTQVSALVNSLNTMSDGIRGIIDDLHPQALTILGLEATLSDALEKRLVVSDDLHWRLNVDKQIDALLTSANQLNLYRIVLELCQNVVKHANASHLEVSLKAVLHHKIRVMVCDDGVGFSAAQVGIKAHGIANIRTRVRSMNAEIRWAENAHEKGTCVQLDIPL